MTELAPSLALPSWLEAELIDEKPARERLARLLDEPWSAHMDGTPFGEESDNLTDRLLVDLAGPEGVEQRMEGYGPSYANGSMRQVVIGERTVIKIPYDKYDCAWDCCDSQLHEAAASVHGYPVTIAGQIVHMPVAACRLVWHRSGLPIIVMERIARSADVYLDERIGKRPGWAAYVDGLQVGYSPRAGEWVVFDAGGVPGHPSFAHLDFARVAA